MFSSLHGNIKCLDGNAADLILVVGQGIGCLQDAIYLLGMTLAKVQTAGQLTHDDHVKAFADVFFF